MKDKIYNLAKYIKKCSSNPLEIFKYRIRQIKYSLHERFYVIKTRYMILRYLKNNPKYELESIKIHGIFKKAEIKIRIVK